MKNDVLDINKAMDDKDVVIMPSGDGLLAEAMEMILSLGRNLTNEEADEIFCAPQMKAV